MEHKLFKINNKLMKKGKLILHLDNFIPPDKIPDAFIIFRVYRAGDKEIVWHTSDVNVEYTSLTSDHIIDADVKSYNTTFGTTVAEQIVNTYDISNLSPGTYTLTVQANSKRKQNVSDEFSYSFEIEELIDFKLDKSQLIFIEYEATSTFDVSTISVWTSNRYKSTNGSYIQIFDENGFCIYSVINSKSGNWNIGETEVNGVKCYKETFTMDSKLTFEAGKKYYISSIAYRYADDTHNTGYYVKPGNYKTLEPITNAVVTDLSSYNYIGEFTNVSSIMNALNSMAVNDYFKYSGTSFTLGQTTYNNGFYARTNIGTYLGGSASTIVSDNSPAGSVGDIIYGHYSWEGDANYFIHDGEKWVHPGWGIANNQPLSPVQGFNSTFYNTAINIDRLYKIEVK